MCGIFGLIAKKESGFTPTTFKSATADLFKLSESRGKEASGLAVLSRNEISVYKKPWPATKLNRNQKFQDFFDGAINDHGKLVWPLAMIGHARLVTNGMLEINTNNQPVIKDGLVGIHNGIIVNDEALWKKFPEIKKQCQVDTEVLLSLIRLFLNQQQSLTTATQTAFNLIKGTASVAVLFNDYPCLLLATNNSSLYVCRSLNHTSLIFASERHTLQKLSAKYVQKKILDEFEILQVKPQTGYLVNLNDLAVTKFSLMQNADDGNKNDGFKSINPKTILNCSPDQPEYSQISDQPPSLVTSVNLEATKIPNCDLSPIESLKRCTKCVLPETMPFIEFDDQGVCNYCKNYQPVKIQGENALKKDIAQFRNNLDRPDCLVPLSGGRDSSYALHYIKNELKMNPVAYSYDWGMLTDLGRRNQARMCGSLGIEHILISADIRTKRRYIRQNVLAWLRKPDLGTIPLFMAGDKQYFYYAEKLRRQMGIKLIIYSENPMEKTDFKSGFCDVKPRFDIDHVYNLGLSRKLKLAFYYFKQALKNPYYLNSSIIDNSWAYLSSYFLPHKYLYLYRYIKWDESKIDGLLADVYDWEHASDAANTWRIGDGTAAFYNYIYYLVAGFTENDTFRSNQIRENVITRQEALTLIKTDNQPRYESIKWYCDTIGIDFEKTLKTINAIPRLYI